MGALRMGRKINWVACLWLGLAAPGLFADFPNAVTEPDAFRESITADNLRAAGFDPDEYKLEVPLGRLQLTRSYVRAGEQGLLSTGLTERGTDVIRLSLNPRGSLEFTQDEARAELHGLELTSSRKRTALVTQGFGSGTTAGTLALTHSDTYASDVGAGFTSSRSDKAGLTVGLTKSLGLTASAEDAESLALVTTATRKYDVALTPTGVSVPLVEYHATTSTVGRSSTDVTQMTLRTPTVEVAGLATVAATHAVTESSASGTDTTETVNVTAAPTEAVSVTASHVRADHETAADTAVTTVGSQIRVRPDTTVTAGYTDSETEGASTTTQRSVAVAMAPPDGTGLGVEASYTDINVTNTEVDPTVRVKLTYALAEGLAVSGQYYDDNARPDPELNAGLKVPLFGGALGLTYSECVYDSSTAVVQMRRTYATELTRPLAWGLTGLLAYQRTDSLTDATTGERLRVGLGGTTTPLGVVDVKYETGRLHTTAGRLPDGSTLSLSLSRKLGSAELAVTGTRQIPSATTGSVEPSDQVHIDLKATW